MAISLKKMRAKEMVSWVEYPEIPGFMIKLKYLSKRDLSNMAKKCTTKQMDFQNPGNVKEEVDIDKLREVVAKEVILDWKGLTLEAVSDKLIPMEDIPEEEKNTEVEPTLENKIAILEDSIAFDNWVQSIMTNLSIFKSKIINEEIENIKK